MTEGASLELTRALAELKADPQTQERYEYLATGHTEGSLTPSETIELGSLVKANTLISALKAEARRRLKSSAA